MVRLKVATPKTAISEIIIFQFQYGAIKSVGSDYLFKVLTLFQFQYGAIKSIPILRKCSATSDFNSNMVRLKATKLSPCRVTQLISIPIWCD